jgi:PDZ domain-containing protein
MSFHPIFAAAVLAVSLLFAGDAQAHSPGSVVAGALQAGTSASRARYELGAVVDVRRANVRGVTILAITPGGAASRMGLQAGDQLRVVNGRRLDDTLTPSAVLEQALREGNGSLKVEAIRNGESLFLSGRADAPGHPAGYQGGDARSCGYVTTRGTVPKVSQGIHAAAITDIDGLGTPLRSVNRHRLSAGRHVLIVSEAIEDLYFDSSQLRNRFFTLRRLNARAHKALVVEVKPGTSVHIGAKLLRDRLDTQSIRDNEYWQPVVWRETLERCD